MVTFHNHIVCSKGDAIEFKASFVGPMCKFMVYFLGVLGQHWGPFFKVRPFYIEFEDQENYCYDLFCLCKSYSTNIKQKNKMELINRVVSLMMTFLMHLKIVETTMSHKITCQIAVNVGISYGTFCVFIGPYKSIYK